ncbi:hypothetical protein PRIC2_004598 [Phytophthora ramorum]
MVTTLQQELQALRVHREQERETMKNLQKFLAGQVRELRTASPQQPSGSVSAQEVGSAPMVRPNSGRTAAHSDRSSASGTAADAIHQKPDVRSSDEIFAAQLQATLQAFAADRVSKNPMGKAVKISEPVVNVKAEPMSGSRTSATGKAESSSGTKSTAPGKSVKRHMSEKSGSSKKSSTSGKGKRTKKSSGKSSDPSDSDPSSDSSKSDSDSDSSNSSSFEDVVPNVHTTPGPGGSLFTFRPYVNASTLEDFNEKASLATRIRWLERFQSFAVQGGWSDKVKIYEMKLKLPAAVRNWRSNLNSNVRRKWKKFLKEFRDMYCKAKTSDSERYYTMIQKKAETPLEFYYRLNKVADKAGIEFNASSKQRERHLKVFTKKLLDSRLRTTLQGQRLRRLKDLEYVLKQHEEMNQDDDYDTPPPKRDFRADNVPRDRFRPKRSGRAYVLHDDDNRDGEHGRQVHFLEDVEEVPSREHVPSVLTTPTADATNVSGSSMDNLSEAVFRAMENPGWRPPTSDFRSDRRQQRFGSPNASKFCDKCKEFGHLTENCWSDIECDRCHRMGHPTHLCRTRPCAICNQFHEGKCEEWKAFQAIKNLARQGALKDLPSPVRKQLLEGKVDPGEQPLN